jgi:hypothetical protein
MIRSWAIFLAGFAEGGCTVIDGGAFLEVPAGGSGEIAVFDRVECACGEGSVGVLLGFVVT